MRTKAIKHFSWMALVAFCSLEPASVSAVNSGEPTSVQMSDTNKGTDGWYGYTIYECSVSIAALVPTDCNTASSTKWEVYFDKIKGKWEWVDVPTYLSYYGYTFDKYKTEADYSISNLSLSFLHKPNDISKLTPCPSLQATVYYSCPSPPPQDPCACAGGTKPGLYMADADGDGYSRGVYLQCPDVAAKEGNVSAATWKGFDCGYMPGQTYSMCGITWQAWAPDSLFDAAYGMKAYATQDAFWNPETVWALDTDKDGYYDATKTVKGCIAPSNYQMVAKAKLQPGDCDDQADFKHPQAEWVKDADWDGYYAAQKTQCQDPGPKWYNVAWHLKNKGKTFKPWDECDDIKEIQKDEFFCKDEDMDNYLSQEVCEHMCFWDPVYANPPGWFQPKDKWDCPKGDTDKTINPAQEWGFDCDGDGYMNDKFVESGCKQPKMPGAGCKYATVKPDSTPVAQYVRLASPEGQQLKKGDCNDINYLENAGAIWVTDADDDGWYDPERSINQCKSPQYQDALSNAIQCDDSPDPKCAEKAEKYTYQNLDSVQDKIKKGDCDDDDKDIQDLMYRFADQDGDGLGDPLVFELVDCQDTNKNVSEPEQEFDWVKAPNDSNPHAIDASAAESIQKHVGSDRHYFFVTKTTPQYCIAQAGSQQANCGPQGKLCMTHVDTNAQDISCLSEAVLQAYCPDLKKHLGAKGFPPQWYMTHDALPYGTVHPIISEQDFSQLGAGAINSWTDAILWTGCLAAPLLKDNGLVLPGYINAIIETDIPFGYDKQSSYAVFVGKWVAQGNTGKTPSIFLIKLKGKDYDFDLYTFLSPPFHKTWSLPRQLDNLSVTLMPKADFNQLASHVAGIIYEAKELAELSYLSAHPFPVTSSICPPREVCTQPCSETTYCIINGIAYVPEGSNCSDTVLASIQEKVFLEGELIEKVMSDPSSAINFLYDPTDTDQDGVSDIAELSIPGVPLEKLAKLALNPSLKPIAKWDSIVLQTPLTTEEALFLQLGKMRAHVLAEDTYKQVEEVLAEHPHTFLRLSFEQFEALIDTVQIAHLVDAPHGAAAYLQLPAASSLRRLYGINFGADIITPEQDMFIDIHMIIKRHGTGEEALAQLSTTILHEILHSHICILNPPSIEWNTTALNSPIEGGYLDQLCGSPKVRDINLEHEFIYAITEWYDEPICGARLQQPTATPPPQNQPLP